MAVRKLITSPPPSKAGRLSVEAYKRQMETIMALRVVRHNVGLCQTCGQENPTREFKACPDCREFARNKKAAMKIHKQQTNTPKTTA